jgi:hypothetical protein
MVDNVQDIELGTLTASGWDTSSAPVASQPNVYQAVTDPTVNSDTTIGVRIGDVWINTATGMEFRCISNADGASIWRPRSRYWMSGVAVTLAADTAENIAATITLPAGIMGLGALRIEVKWTATASANAKTCRARLGGIGGTENRLQAFGASDITQRAISTIQNRATVSSQVGVINGAGTGGIGVSTGAHVTSTINTGAATTLVITGQKATGSETLTLESYLVELLRPDIGP